MTEGTPLRLYANTLSPCFDRLQESAARLAGLLVETEIVGRSALDSPSRLLGLQAKDQATEILATANVRKADAHFHHHLTLALQRLSIAWAAWEDRRAGLIAAPDPFPALQSTWRELQTASRLLPGFDTVDFRNSCCALHQAPH